MWRFLKKNKGRICNLCAKVGYITSLRVQASKNIHSQTFHHSHFIYSTLSTVIAAQSGRMTTLPQNGENASPLPSPFTDRQELENQLDSIVATLAKERQGTESPGEVLARVMGEKDGVKGEGEGDSVPVTPLPADEGDDNEVVGTDVIGTMSDTNSMKVIAATQAEEDEGEVRIPVLPEDQLATPLKATHDEP